MPLGELILFFFVQKYYFQIPSKIASFSEQPTLKWISLQKIDMIFNDDSLSWSHSFNCTSFNFCEIKKRKFLKKINFVYFTSCIGRNKYFTTKSICNLS